MGLLDGNAVPDQHQDHIRPKSQIVSHPQQGALLRGSQHPVKLLLRHVEQALDLPGFLDPGSKL